MKTLSEKAVLVRLKIGRFQPYAYDESATRQVHESVGVERAGRFNKRLLHKSERFLAANSALTAVYTHHNRLTLPWLDEGMRILPTDMYFQYNTDINKLVATADAAVKDLVDHWQEEIDRDRERLGALFNAADYPDDISDRFYVSTSFFPVPSAGDFRVEIDEEDKLSLEKAVKEAEGKAAQHVIQSLIEPLEKAAEKLHVPIGDDGAKFRDSLITNIGEVASRMRKLNITGDHAIDEAIDRIMAFVRRYENDIDVLRRGPTSRALAANEAEEMVKRLQGILGGTA